VKSLASVLFGRRDNGPFLLLVRAPPFELSFLIWVAATLEVEEALELLDTTDEESFEREISACKL
jgi:hypothetical protein